TPATPHIDGGKQEQPDHVHEVPVPGSELETEVMLLGEVAGIDARQADDQEDRADEHVEAMEAGRHEEGGAVDVAGVGEAGAAVLDDLNDREQDAQGDGQPEAS